MFPIIAVGTIIGAVASVIKGANWVSDHLASPKDDSTAPGARMAGFQAALAAENAGQVVPVAAPPPASQAVPSTVPIMPRSHDTDYQSLARMRAGLAAYQAADLQQSRHIDAAGQ